MYLIAADTLALLTHPEEMARLLEDPSLLLAAVEELLRFTNPVNLPSVMAFATAWALPRRNSASVPPALGTAPSASPDRTAEAISPPGGSGRGPAEQSSLRRRRCRARSCLPAVRQPHPVPPGYVAADLTDGLNRVVQCQAR